MSADTDQSPPPVPEPEENQLCTSCLAPNKPEANFCIKCGAPLSSYAATGPFESVLAEGHVYRKAVERPRNLIILLGMWVIFGMTALAGALILAHDGADSGESALAAFLLITSVIILWKTTRNYRARKQDHRESHD